MTDRFVQEQKDFFIEKIARFCDKCGEPYHSEDIKIIQEKAPSVIIHFSCRSCKSSNVASVVYPMGFTTRTPVNSDLKVDEFAKFATGDTVSLDDVLDVHVCFQESKGCVKI